MNILLRDFNAKLWVGGIFEATVRIDSLR